MGRTVIFYDGEYVRKIFDKAGYRLDVPKSVAKVLNMTNIDENDLLRVIITPLRLIKHRGLRCHKNRGIKIGRNLRLT